uniref:Putative secreted protein n=1 Tax=Anopheles darlingi TaxID=43151 RepID=A0A2M4DK73_ANODA
MILPVAAFTTATAPVANGAPGLPGSPRMVVSRRTRSTGFAATIMTPGSLLLAFRRNRLTSGPASLLPIFACSRHYGERSPSRRPAESMEFLVCWLVGQSVSGIAKQIDS